MKKQAAVIGNFDLVIECIKILEEQNFNITCLFSETSSVLSWAKSQNIFLAKDLDSFWGMLKQREIDYLFSIQNPFIIPKSVLNSINKLVINYHNGLLPKYAEIKNNAWVIWSGEKESGITWHSMSNVAEKRYILKQKKFLLDKNETAFSLELKCQEYAKQALKELSTELCLETLHREAQSSNKEELLNSFSRPCGFAIIDWNNTATTISRQFRALDFGLYANPVSTLKFKYEKKYFVVLKVTPLKCKTATATPGTVVDVKNGLLQVATKTRDILVDYKALNGNMNAFEIPKGEILSSETYPLKKQVHLAEQIARDEPYWKKALSQFFPGKNFIQNKILNFDVYSQLFNIKFSTLLPSPLQHDLEDVLTVLLSYLYRVNNYEGFSLAISEDFSHIPEESLHELFLAIKPLNVSLSNILSFTDAKKSVTQLFNKIKNKNVCCKDLLVRHSYLQATLERNAILLNISEKPLAQNNIYPIIININETDKCLSLFVANSFLDKLPFFLNFMESHLTNLVKDWIVRDTPLNKINLLSSEELQYLQAWNDTHVSLSNTKSISSIIDDVCSQFPDNVAIETKDKKISYQELKQHSDQIGKNILYFLQAQNLANNFVCVFLDKSINTILAFLGVLKAGLTYVVLDATYPDAYIENIIHSTQAQVFISQSSKYDRLCKIINNIENYGRQIYLDLDKLLLERDQDIQLPDNISTTSLAYILFTSGSTGNPKGVMISQRSVINLINAVNASMRISKKDKLLQFSTLAFDTSVWEIYASFFCGGTLYIPEPSEVLLGKSLQKTITANNISLAIFPPSVLKIQPYFESETLKTIVVGGEECPPILPKQWGKYYRFVNVYGPTESTVIATMSEDLKPNDMLSIGRPIQNYQITICDRYQMTLPIGAIGEIIISGAGVAQGYINNTTLTQQKFKLICVLGQEKMGYLSGDLGKWTKKGQIQYIGRIDSQLKVRGFRVETIMIEQMINTYTGINSCIVLPKQTEKSRLFLNAYILTDSKSTKPDLKNLKSFLKAKLPHFMIPKNFYLINELPLTATGKIDHKKLLGDSFMSLETSYEESSPLA